MRKLIILPLLVMLLSSCGDACMKTCSPGYYCQVINKVEECVTDPFHIPKGPSHE